MENKQNHKISSEEVVKVMKKLHVDFDFLYHDPEKFPELFGKWMEVELEHGTKYGMKQTNVTNDDPTYTAMIVIAHVTEIPDYYERLYDMEKIGDDYWKNKKKPHILHSF